MHFQTDKIEDFLSVFEQSKLAIRNFPGCKQLQLIQDLNHPNCICTSSVWESEEDLENYRNSDLFKTTWAKTKILFSDKPSAKSFKILHLLK